jgi:hypothetical protein
MMGRASDWRCSVISPFDVFRVDEQGVLLWCGDAETFESAKKKARLLAQSDRCEHVIFDQATGDRITVKPDAPLPD